MPGVLRLNGPLLEEETAGELGWGCWGDGQVSPHGEGKGGRAEAQNKVAEKRIHLATDSRATPYGPSQDVEYRRGSQDICDVASN